VQVVKEEQPKAALSLLAVSRAQLSSKEAKAPSVKQESSMETAANSLLLSKQEQKLSRVDAQLFEHFSD
jgi:hypothetical protein